MGNIFFRRRNEDVFVALYDFNNGEPSCLVLTKGHKYKILQRSNKDWWYAIDLHSREPHLKGFVPFNYVVQCDTLEAQDWFFDVDRWEADSLIMDNDNPMGTFLVRPSSKEDEFALSLKIYDEKKQIFRCKHYLIKKSHTGYFVGESTKTYPTVADLIAQYMRSRRLGIRLEVPCPRPEPSLADLDPETHQNWELKREDIVLRKQIATGNFGTVYYAKYKRKEQVAVKTLKEGVMDINDFMTEASVMKGLRHKNIIQLYGVCTTKLPIFIVTEYVSGGSLLNFLVEQIKISILSFQQLIHMAAQVSAGMQYLESIDLVHRDLAARNVLVGKNRILKICDFGLARVIQGEYISQRNINMPFRWMALEWLNDGRYSIKSDVWSFGILMMEIFTYGERPYKEFTDASSLIIKLNDGYRMPKPERHHLPNDIYDLIFKCWQRDPEHRPTFEFLSNFLRTAISDRSEYNEEDDLL